MGALTEGQWAALAVLMSQPRPAFSWSPAYRRRTSPKSPLADRCPEPERQSAFADPAGRRTGASASPGTADPDSSGQPGAAEPPDASVIRMTRPTVFPAAAYDSASGRHQK